MDERSTVALANAKMEVTAQLRSRCSETRERERAEMRQARHAAALDVNNRLRHHNVKPFEASGRRAAEMGELEQTALAAAAGPGASGTAAFDQCLFQGLVELTPDENEDVGSREGVALLRRACDGIKKRKRASASYLMGDLGQRAAARNLAEAKRRQQQRKCKRLLGAAIVNLKPRRARPINISWKTRQVKDPSGIFQRRGSSRRACC